MNIKCVKFIAIPLIFKVCFDLCAAIFCFIPAIFTHLFILDEWRERYVMTF